MHNGKKFLALLPARSGSKGCPGKNIRALGGKPLLAWSIEAVKQSRYIDRLIVSTDDQAIADVARQLGADVPFLRPGSLASDNARMIDVIDHSLKFIGKQEKVYDYVVLIQPTSPFREGHHLDEAIELLCRKDAQAVVSVTPSEHLPFFCNTLPVDGNMENFVLKQYRNINRQEMGQYYHLNGAIYIAACEFILRERDWFGPQTYAYIMDRAFSVDIDTPDDFLFAEFLLSRKGIL